MKKLTILFVAGILFFSCSTPKENFRVEEQNEPQKINDLSLNAPSDNDSSKKYLSDIGIVELNYGICQSRISGTKILADSPTGVHEEATDFKIVENTADIPCHSNQKFGVHYVVKARENINVPVEIRWTFPKEIENEYGQRFSQVAYTAYVSTNEDHHAAYTLGKKYLEVKGDWKYEMFHNGNKLYEKKFHLK